MFVVDSTTNIIIKIAFISGIYLKVISKIRIHVNIELHSDKFWVLILYYLTQGLFKPLLYIVNKMPIKVPKSSGIMK